MTKEFLHTLDWEIISKYLSDEMTESEREDFEAQVKVNPSYAEAIKASGKDLMHTDLYLANQTFDGEEAWANVKSKITKNKNITFKIIKPSAFKTMFKIAASILILLGIGLLSQTTYNHMYPNYTFVSGIYETNKSITLEDGSIITLNSNSKLIYPKVFKQNERSVELIGEAFFDIAKNPNKVFIIKAKNAEIKVLGTSFNINAATNKVEVLVKTGKVQFSAINKPSDKLILIPGDFASLDQSKLVKADSRDDNYLSWKTRQLILKNTKLQDVAEILNRTYQVNIRFQESELKNLRLNSTFDHDPLEYILDYMCITFNLVYEKKDNDILIKRAN